MPTQLDLRQSVLRSALSMVGSAANDTADTILPKIDAELAKLFEDRNVLLTDGGIITFTGTQIQFTENLKITINQKISGAAPQVIDLGNSNVNLNNNEIWYATLNRGAGTATTSIVSTMPAVTSANQEIFLLAKRVDAGDGTQRIYWRNGMAMNAGQSVRLGASGSGSGGSGVGDDLDALVYRASFSDDFSDGPTSALSAVDTTAAHTDTNAYSAAKAMYQLSYDAGKTIAAGTTTTNINISANAAYTVQTGDMVIVGGLARRITAVATQASFTTEAFPAAPTLAAQVTVSEAVHTKDVYNLAVDGTSLAASFGAATFSNILVDYEDTTTVGDNIFDVNVAPVIAYVASHDGSSFTAVTVRTTNQMDTFNSLDLNAAGTGLTLRFFANKTTGSGSVNILRYKAFMQKSLAGSSGGVINSAYAFTNGVGTPYNCTIGLSGGKTSVTFSSGFTYALGVGSGSPYGSIDVYLNGQLIPRFINATLTPDASYTEVNPSVILLDRDYSASNVNVEVLQRVAIVDSSTSNTTSLSYHNEMFQFGFQGFVKQDTLMQPTTTAGTPASGIFYSTIIGRAAMTDLSQDLKPRMAVERIASQGLYPIYNEVGPSGEPVYGVLNDTFGQVRLVGHRWGVDSQSDSNGPHLQSNNIGDYVEVTFYGTGLNFLIHLNANNNTIQASVDGGGAVTAITGAGTGVINNRNYCQNTVVQAASNLTLGVHTVKLTLTAGTFFIFEGYEVLNESSSLKVNPGIAYINGNKLSLLSQSILSYNSGFEAGTLGTRGGRVLVYHKSDGTIGKAVNPAGSQLNLTAADHSNEEMIRFHTITEFGAGRTDDFSFFFDASERDTAFTMDDGTTTLVADNGQQFLGANGDVVFSIGASSLNFFISLTFVGTGCDMSGYDTGASLDTLTVFVDGISIGTLASVGTANITRVRKLVSGLPFGSHTVTIQRTAAAGGATIRMKNFTVYGPKKPTLPTGAVELADYGIMADFVANATAGLNRIATGVLRKGSTREFTYTGTGYNANVPGLSVGVYINGWSVYGNASGDKLTYYFWGTGFEHRAKADTTWSNNISVRLQNITAAGALGLATTGNFPSLVSSVYGGYSFAAGVLSQAVSTTVGSGLQISGLPLSLWKVEFTNNTSNFFLTEALDIITPIYSPRSNIYAELQNTLMVGQNGISDNRKITPVKDAIPPVKAWAQALAIQSSPTTTATTLVPMPDMGLMIKTNGGALEIAYSCSTANSGNTNATITQIYVDGIAVGREKVVNEPTATYDFHQSDVVIVPVAPGTHKVEVYWRTAGGTVTASAQRRTLTAKEL